MAVTGSGLNVERVRQLEAGVMALAVLLAPGGDDGDGADVDAAHDAASDLLLDVAPDAGVGQPLPAGRP